VPQAIITLLTDFGLADTYVGQMKGAILSIAPDASIVDVTHAVPPQDVHAGAFLLWSAVDAFPAETIHVGVVDPGVGSQRRGIAIQSHRGDAFVGPDNGLLRPAVDRLGGVNFAVELTQPEFWRPHTSTTFHGRDIFGAVAAHLANGVPLADLGQPIAHPSAEARWPRPQGKNGEVIHVDAYGNLVTNFPAADLPARFAVELNGHRARQASFYAEARPGELLALVGSAGLLEISARNGDAANLTGATRGTPVRIV
jgi:S-adenosylmethionine hydrolase